MRKVLIKTCALFAQRLRKAGVKLPVSILFMLSFSLSITASVRSQEIVFPKKGIYSYQDVFDEVKKQTGYSVMYSNNRLNKSGKIELKKERMTVDELMQECTQDRDLSYQFKDDYIVIVPKPKVSSQPQKEKRELKGKVKDPDGEPLPGATIVVKGTQVGMVTDIEGNFTLKIPVDATTVVVSFVGLTSQEVDIAGKDFIEVMLKSDAQDIAEVIVTGYQKIDRKLFTGSATRLNSADIKIDGIADASRSLQGKVAGLEIENVSGTFGAAPVVRVRGNASINGTNKPLWVVDGVVMEDAVELTNEDLTSGNLSTILSSAMVGINPEDIESFQVLKDASATALYGARAMNGVVVITTKRGVSQETQVTYSSSFMFKDRPTYSQFDIMNSGSEMSVYQELYEKDWLDIAQANRARSHGAVSNMFRKIALREIPWGTNGGMNYNFLQPYADANTDWFDVLFKNSLQQQHSLTINGGDEKSRIYASIGYLHDSGQTIADNVRNYTGSIRTEFDISDKFKIGFKLSGNVRDQRIPGSRDRQFEPIEGVYERNFDINPFNYALYTSRSIRPYDQNGELEYFRRDYAPFNIIDEIDKNYVDLDVNELIFQADLEYKLLKNLTFRSAMQGRWYRSKAQQTIHETSNQAEAYRADDPLIRDANQYLFEDRDHPELDPYTVLPQGGFLNTTEHALNSYYIRNSFDWSTNVADLHSINVMAGHEVRYNDRIYDYLEGWGYMFDKGGLILTDPNFIKYLDSRGAEYYDHDITKGRYISAFITSAYSYMGKYIVNMTANYAGDNRTGKSRKARYLPTWNISGAWNISEESWFTPTWIDMLKLKATYGLSGDNPINASAALAIYGHEPLRPTMEDRETVLKIETLENSELTFEKLKEFSTGIEFGLFNNRIYAEVEYYSRRSEDLLGIIETSGVGGKQYKMGNVGEMKVNGFEFTLNTVNIHRGDFKWTSNFTYSFGKDEITKWKNRARIAQAVQPLGANLEGYSRGSLFSIPFAGLDANGIPTFYGPDDEIIQYVNLQERNDIERYLKHEGPTTPRGFGGLSNMFTYKNLSLSFGFVYRYGNKIRLDDAFNSNYTDYNALPGDLINRWQFPGDEQITNIPAILDKTMEEQLDERSLNPYELYNKSDLRVADGDFIRLKDIKVSYKLPKKLLQGTFIRSANLSAQAYNLWLLYSDKKLNGIDPEFFQSGGISLPMSRTYTFSVNLKF